VNSAFWWPRTIEITFVSITVVAPDECMTFFHLVIQNPCSSILGICIPYGLKPIAPTLQREERVWWKAILFLKALSQKWWVSLLTSHHQELLTWLHLDGKKAAGTGITPHHGKGTTAVINSKQYRCVPVHSFLSFLPISSILTPDPLEQGFCFVC
jgi:hypothetical protein